ncbi:MAG TPA: hypothetical protein VFZ61_02210, partial [Polyangiales bacterium]
MCAALWASSRVGAQDAATAQANRKEAAGHFTQGVDLFEEGAFRAALIEFERANQIAPDYRLLYNIGQAQLELHDWLHATQSFERYLADGGASVSAERRREVEGYLASLSARVGRLSIHLNVQDAEVFVDDQLVGTAPLPTTVAVNVGRHRIYARTKVGTSAEKVIDVAGGDLLDVRLELASAPAARESARGDDAPAESSRSLSRMQRGAIASWALALPGIAGALATGLIAKNKQDDLDAQLEIIPATDDSKSEASDLSDSIRTLSITSDVLTGVSAALAVTGVALWVVDAKR